MGDILCANVAASATPPDPSVPESLYYVVRKDNVLYICGCKSKVDGKTVYIPYKDGYSISTLEDFFTSFPLTSV